MIATSGDSENSTATSLSDRQASRHGRIVRPPSNVMLNVSGSSNVEGTSMCAPGCRTRTVIGQRKLAPLFAGEACSIITESADRPRAIGMALAGMRETDEHFVLRSAEAVLASA